MCTRRIVGAFGMTGNRGGQRSEEDIGRPIQKMNLLRGRRGQYIKGRSKQFVAATGLDHKRVPWELEDESGMGYCGVKPLNRGFELLPL